MCIIFAYSSLKSDYLAPICRQLQTRWNAAKPTLFLGWYFIFLLCFLHIYYVYLSSPCLFPPFIVSATFAGWNLTILRDLNATIFFQYISSSQERQKKYSLVCVLTFLLKCVYPMMINPERMFHSTAYPHNLWVCRFRSISDDDVFGRKWHRNAKTWIGAHLKT